MATRLYSLPLTAVSTVKKHTSAALAARRALTRRLSHISSALLLMLALPALGDTLPTRDLTLGEHTLSVEFAVTGEQRSRGLMEREHMDEYAGMLFVYDSLGYRCFWMQNTLIPLTLAFLADDGTVLQLVDMEPLSTDTHCSNQRVRYALELNQGWFERNDVSVGDRLQGLENTQD